MGLVSSIIDQNFPPKATWDTSLIPDLTGRVIIVTGGNSGLGYETAKALLSHNAKVYVACRDRAKTDVAIESLKKETGKTAFFLELDLASLASVKACADSFMKIETELHVLFNNAGVMSPPISHLTQDGYDLQFGVNVLGHFYLTELLLPALKAGAASSADHVSRVINTSSQMHLLAKMDYDTLTDTTQRKKISPSDLYAQSTFGKIVFSQELARRYGTQGIVSIALHPGNLKTDLGRHLPALLRRIVHMTCYPPPKGALTQLWGGTVPEAASMNGKYLIPWARVGEPRKDALDPKIGGDLWEWMETQVRGI
ncbi:NAD(P)-binding protein [Punctularia strigosozonata HHB-11173 SS5]|uniref:NAD(P)-binding protein n=1 Tax=Punctularia strigosozonata (strain HHB-11173) TaxID=741275 RepID=UPI0004416F55|nr:NAD(P)-binding protein [Punctularia strigosozonata HHB-11173 SS5]EIN11082.1 NAD(P)-binding protein [Punctularia strigosozonata HHB-11173 SS5]